MALKYHHIRLLESTYQDLLKYKRPHETIDETLDRVLRIYDDLPKKYLIMGV